MYTENSVCVVTACDWLCLYIWNNKCHFTMACGYKLSCHNSYSLNFRIKMCIDNFLQFARWILQLPASYQQVLNLKRLLSVGLEMHGHLLLFFVRQNILTIESVLFEFLGKFLVKVWIEWKCTYNNFLSPTEMYSALNGLLGIEWFCKYLLRLEDASYKLCNVTRYSSRPDTVGCSAKIYLHVR